MSCNHGHDTRLQQFVCDTVRDLGAEFKAPCALIVCPDDAEPAISMFANTAAMAQFAQMICTIATRAKRPTDCEHCADAFDRMQQALAILNHVVGRC